MTQARQYQISLESTAYYHLVNRCVRRAFLTGDDPYTGKNFNHRRQWLQDRIHFLSSVFCIDICAFAIMSNHYHIVVFVDENESNLLSYKDIIQRWQLLFGLHPLVERWQSGQTISKAESDGAVEIIEKWRNRLMDVSWFMRCLNENIARRANDEDKCSGRFWEGRFKSQALLDEKALLTCMAYVDLNPVRAKIATCSEDSDFTSIQERCKPQQPQIEKNKHTNEIKPLLGFIGNEYKDQVKGIAYSFTDYLALIDWNRHILKERCRGNIADDIKPALERLGLSEKEWQSVSAHFGSRYHRAVGTLEELHVYAENTGKKWIAGQRECDKLLH
jgi:REP element-mobilizing transposase RayT